MTITRADLDAGRIDFSDIELGRALPAEHPGVILKEEFMGAFGLSNNALAHALNVPPNRITMIVNGKRAISADTAIRLGRYFGMTAEFWLNLQHLYDIRAADRAAIEREVRPRAA